MNKRCINCGADLPTDAKFCGNCGTVFEEKPIAPVQESVETGYLSQQPGQPQGYTPMGQPPKKSHAKILAVVAIIIIAVVLAVVFFVLFTGGGHSSEFVGTWTIVSGGNSSSQIGTTIIFEGNGDFKVGSMGTSMKVGTWNVEGGKLCIEAIGTISSGSSKQCVSYSFSDGGRMLTITPPTGSGLPLVLSKQ